MNHHTRTRPPCDEDGARVSDYGIETAQRRASTMRRRQVQELFGGNYVKFNAALRRSTRSSSSSSSSSSRNSSFEVMLQEHLEQKPVCRILQVLHGL